MKGTELKLSRFQEQLAQRITLSVTVLRWSPNKLRQFNMPME